MSILFANLPMSDDTPPPADEPARDGAHNEEFVRLFSLHYGPLQAFVASLVPHAEEGDELFQRTSITLWRKFDRFDPAGNFLNWACGVAVNVLRNYRREQTRQRTYLLGDDVLELVIQSRQESAGRLEERRSLLEECLEKMPDDERELIAACYGGQSTIKEVAEDRSRTPNAVYKHLAVLRAALHQCVENGLAQGGPRP